MNGAFAGGFRANSPRGIRRLTRSVLLALACLAAACATTPRADLDSRPLLNSERIEEVFGSYGVEVLEEADSLRVSNLFSRDGSDRVGRTFAVVRYARPVDPRLDREHQRITAGGSIGAVFTSAGWTVDKAHRWVGTIPVDEAFGRIRGLMALQGTPSLAAHVYDLAVERDGVAIVYATLVEVHHPDYLTEDDLQAIYGPVPTWPTAEVRAVLETTAREMRE